MNGILKQRWVALVILSLIQGASVIIIEIVGAKIIAPFFGSSLYIWSATLSTTLGALATGYFLGGILSKRNNIIATLLCTLSIAGLMTIILPFSAPLIISAFESFGLQVGSLLSIFFYLFPPMCFMGMTSPMIIQLLNQGKTHAGKIAGSIYAISTVGGILGSLLSSFYLIPYLGMKLTSIIIGLVLITAVTIIYGMLKGNNEPTNPTPVIKKKKRTKTSPSNFRGSVKISLPILLLISFIEGGSVMVIEITGAKILSTSYGTSLFIWSVIFSVTLLGLAIGYYWGGYLSRKFKTTQTLFTVLAIGGLWAAFAPLLGSRIALSTFDLGLILGAVTLSMTTLFPSVICMGMVSPLIIQQITTSDHEIGKSSGRIFCISTVGGILATLFAGFFLLPNLGIKNTSFLFGGILILIAVIYFGYIKQYRSLIAIAACILLVILMIPRNNENEQLIHRYSKVGILGEWKVMDFLIKKDLKNNTVQYQRKLILNGIDQTNSQVGYLPLSLWNYPHKLGAYSSIKPIGSNALLLGMGGGSIAHELVAMGHQVDIVELDEHVKYIAEEYFKYDRSKSNLYIDDARHFIRKAKKKYDVVIMDLVIGEVQPAHVFSFEGFNDLKKILKEDALVIVNFQGNLSDPAYSRGPLSIYKTMDAAGFKVNYYRNQDEEITPSLSQDIFFLGSLTNLDYKSLLSNPRYNQWFEYDDFSYDRLISEEPLDLSIGEVLYDDKPKLEVINSAAILNWRKNKIEQNVKKMLELGVPLY